MVGSLVCKATGASWSYDYIRRHSIVAELSVRCRVPERELLFVKANSVSGSLFGKMEEILKYNVYKNVGWRFIYYWDKSGLNVVICCCSF